MNALIRKALFSEPVGPLWKWRYVKLGFVIIWVISAGWNDLLRTHFSPYVGYEHVLIALLVLLIFLTTDFRWQRSTFVALRIGMITSMLLAFASLWYSILCSHLR